MATVLLWASGCALMVNDQKSADTGGLGTWLTGSRSGDEDGPSLKTVRLEATIVTRPTGDARIRRYIWEELDESGLMSPDVRRNLNASGFRVGVAGSTKPWALQSLATEATAVRRSGGDGQRLTSPELSSAGMTSIGPGFNLLPNGTSLLEIQGQLDTLELPIRNFPSLTGLRDRSNFRCVIEVSVREISDGWVLLNVLPQVHSGNETARLSVGTSFDSLPVRQNVYPLYEQQFAVKLMHGEVAVIGRSENDDWTLGSLFFRPDPGINGTERLLMIRMAGIDVLKGRSDPGFRLSSLGR